jgi:hypothetical protein
MARLGLSGLEEGRENAFLDRWTAVLKTCKTSRPQTLENSARQIEPSAVLEPEGYGTAC